MQFKLELPRLKLEEVRTFIKSMDLDSKESMQKRKRNSSFIPFENFLLDDIYFGRANSKRNRTLSASVVEVQRSHRKTNEKRHVIEVKFFKENENVETVFCTLCDNAKASCNAISPFVTWIEVNLPKGNSENVAPEENIQKKNGTRECYVLVKKEIITPEPASAAPVAPKALTKVKKERIPITPLQLESAQKLSMFSLIKEYKGNSPEDFLKLCTDRMMRENNCGSIELLTIEQADTDLWHELRKGRITASRIHEASRCTMLNGSLTDKIMGLSRGFSFAMKRGTDLEGHVFAVLKKEYPNLRNTGLVLDPQFPWMGASPDGICDEFVLEIKCPYTQKTYDCYVDVTKLSKNYFAQIQLQMHMTHKTKALLGVAALDFEKTKKVTKVWIDYDKAYVDKIMAESYEFWCKAVFKALLKKRGSKK
ncbi:uncharacterized protein LOC131283145 [Anopheles ziemanni]|uniref:uncharacterized protein LOC131262933 n=1 Tax=Anopheles coustani TaxID=139045 RepID=UPI002659E1CA|nr:uncharacterized protein LOC131262933 [Anopheles coustani]XP_058168705.1 uncharacterized protein LOC131283145 [Anopheles ziemanni]